MCARIFPAAFRAFYFYAYIYIFKSICIMSGFLYFLPPPLPGIGQWKWEGKENKGKCGWKTCNNFHSFRVQKRKGSGGERQAICLCPCPWHDFKFGTRVVVEFQIQVDAICWHPGVMCWPFVKEFASQIAAMWRVWISSYQQVEWRRIPP